MCAAVGSAAAEEGAQGTATSYREIAQRIPSRGGGVGVELRGADAICAGGILTLVDVPIAGCAGQWEPASAVVVRVLTGIVRAGSECSEGPTRVMRQSLLHSGPGKTRGQDATDDLDARRLNHTANRQQFQLHSRNRSLVSETETLGAKTPNRGAADPDQLHGSTCSLCILLQECILSDYISSHAPRDKVSPTLRSTAITSTCRVPL